MNAFDGYIRSTLSEKTIRYRTVVNPQNIEQPLAPALDHFFNQQTHHRGRRMHF